MGIIKTDYSIDFSQTKLFFKKIPEIGKYGDLNFIEITNIFKKDLSTPNKIARSNKFFFKMKGLYNHQKINFIFNNNLKKVILVSKYSNSNFFKKENISKMIFLLNKLKRNSFRYNYIFSRRVNPHKIFLLKSFDIHRNKLKKANNSVKDKEYEDYLEKISSYVEQKENTVNNRQLIRLQKLIDAVPKPLDKGRKYFLDNMFFLKSVFNNNASIRVLSRDIPLIFNNINLMYFHNILKLDKKTSPKTNNFVVKLFRKKYLYYYSMVFLEEKIIKAISPGILLKFFEIYEKHKKKNKKALRLMIRTLAKLFNKFDKKVFNRTFIIEFFDKGIIDTLSTIKNLSLNIDFLFINFKFCKEKRVFKKARLFKRNKMKKLLKINLDYIKSLNFKKRKEKYFNLLLK